MSVLNFLQLLLNKPIFALPDFVNHMGAIAKLFSSFQIGCGAKAVKEKASAIVMQILESNKNQINLNSFLEETTDCEFLKPLREEYKSNMPKLTVGKAAFSLSFFFKHFLYLVQQ